MTWRATETVRRLHDIDDPDVATAYLDELASDMAEPAMPREVRSLAGTLRRWRAQILAWHRARVSNASCIALAGRASDVIRPKRRSSTGPAAGQRA